MRRGLSVCSFSKGYESPVLFVLVDTDKDGISIDGVFFLFIAMLLQMVIFVVIENLWKK